MMSVNGETPLFVVKLVRREESKTVVGLRGRAVSVVRSGFITMPETPS